MCIDELSNAIRRKLGEISVYKRRKLIQCPIILFRPKKRIIFNIDKLRCDAKPISYFLDTALKGCPNFQFFTILLKVPLSHGAPVNISSAFFNPEGIHVFMILMSGSPEISENDKEEVQKIINSIKTGT